MVSPLRRISADASTPRAWRIMTRAVVRRRAVSGFNEVNIVTRWSNAAWTRVPGGSRGRRPPTLSFSTQKIN